MQKIVLEKLNKLLKRFNELKILLIEPKVIRDRKLFICLSKKFSKLKIIIDLYCKYKKLKIEIGSLNILLKEPDREMRELILIELKSLSKDIDFLKKKLISFLFPQEKISNNSVFLELRAATGGKESAIFVKNLMRMYIYYSEFKKWAHEVVSCTFVIDGGYKDVVIRLIGSDVFSCIKFESGIHRVQRVPKTESQGRIHTSTCTVAVLPEVDEINGIELNIEDLRIDTYRASGAGGQHVNQTDSAVRITHLPTSLVAECQDERSQHKNKAKALSLLKSKLLAKKRTEQKLSIDNERRNLIGTGSRSEKIRTYNYIKNRVTDHRINLTLYRLDDIMNGKLNLVIDCLMTHDSMND